MVGVIYLPPHDRAQSERRSTFSQDGNSLGMPSRSSGRRRARLCYAAARISSKMKSISCLAAGGAWMKDSCLPVINRRHKRWASRSATGHTFRTALKSCLSISWSPSFVHRCDRPEPPTATRVLVRHQPQPGAQIPSAMKLSSITDGSDQRCGDQRTNWLDAISRPTCSLSFTRLRCQRKMVARPSGEKELLVVEDGSGRAPRAGRCC